MPVDPNISLSVVGGQHGAQDAGWGNNALSPLDMAGKMADIQGKMNQVKLFNQTFAARQKFGQIMATAPDQATGVAAALKDPDIAAFVPELTAQAQATQNSILDAQGKVQTMGYDAFENTLKHLPAVLQDQSQWKTLKDSTLGLTAPAARGAVASSLGHLEEVLADDPKLSPEQNKANKLKLISGWTIAGGMGDAVPKILGAPGQADLSGTVQPIVTTPAQGGVNGEQPGQITNAGNALTKVLPPQLGPPGSVAVPAGGPGNPLMPGQAAQASVPAVPAASGPPEVPTATDGKPLVPEGYRPKVPGREPGVVGNVPIGPLGEIAKGAAANFIGPELHNYQNSIQSIPMLDQMSHNFSVMAKGGGFLVPGTAAEARVAIGNLGNTFAKMIGAEAPFDPGKIGAAESIIKDTQRLGIGVLTSLLGTQREAASVIESMTNKGVPGISNSPLGAQILTSSIKQATQRQIDLYDFKNWWINQPETRGDLTGAETEFNRLRPAKEYMQRALDQFGLTEQGFKDINALKKAVNDGYITEKQAEDIARKQKLSLT